MQYKKTAIEMFLNEKKMGICYTISIRRFEMSYETVIEQVRTLPEALLNPVSAFIKLLQTEQGDFFTMHTIPKNKQSFFDLAGKIHLDSSSVTEFREISII